MRIDHTDPDRVPVWRDPQRPRCKWCLDNTHDNHAHCERQLEKAWAIYTAGNSVGRCRGCWKVLEVERPGGTPFAPLLTRCGKCGCPPPLVARDERIVGGWRPDGGGCVEKVHPTELSLLAREGGLGQ